MQIKEVLRLCAKEFIDVSDIPQKEAMLLLSHHLQKPMDWLMAHSDDDTEVTQEFWNDVKRRSLHEPLEYILQKASFYEREFEVDHRVLIPRPETELLVDHVFSLTCDLQKPRIVEIGCGSGIVSIMLALKLPTARISAVDISQEALHVSRANAKKHGVEDTISFVCGSYLGGIDESIDVIVSNPPYIASGASLDKNLSYEPSVALYGGEKGDEMLKHIIDLFDEKKAMLLVCEMGYDQKISLDAYAQEKGLRANFYTDLAGFDRGFWIRREK